MKHQQISIHYKNNLLIWKLNNISELMNSLNFFNFIINLNFLFKTLWPVIIFGNILNLRDLDILPWQAMYIVCLDFYKLFYFI